MQLEWLFNPWFYIIVLIVASIIIYLYVSWQFEMKEKAEKQRLLERLKRLEEKVESE